MDGRQTEIVGNVQTMEKDKKPRMDDILYTKEVPAEDE